MCRYRSVADLAVVPALLALTFLMSPGPGACGGQPPNGTWSNDVPDTLSTDEAALSWWSAEAANETAPGDWWSGSAGDAVDPGELLTELMREAAALRGNPLDLNAASVAELVRIPGLAGADAVAIVGLREKRGAFAGVEDLAESGRFGWDVVRAIRPYVVCRVRGPAAAGAAGVGGGRASPGGHDGPAVTSAGPGGAGRLAWSIRARSSWKVDPDDAWSTRGLPDIAAGSGTYARIRLGAGDTWSAGAAVERDPWECRIADHSAFHLSWRSAPASRDAYGLSCVAGDLLADWGQGLLLCAGRFGGAECLPRAADRVRGYDGAGETVSRRGVHVSVRRGVVRAVALATRTRLDASIDEDGLASSIRTSGTHRTDGERSGRGSLRETCLGARVVVERPGALALGASVVSLSYSPGLARGDPERQRFRFHGGELGAASFDVALSGDGWRLGAEAAATSFGGRAFVVAASVKASRARARLGFGHLSRDYWTPQGGGLPAVSGGCNGGSAWISADYRATGSLRCRASAVVTGRPWRTYYRELPDNSERVTLGISARVNGAGTLDAELRVRSRSSDGEGADRTKSSGTRLSLRTDGRMPLVVTLTRYRTSRGELDLGELHAVDARCDVPVGDRSLLSAGAASVTSWGDSDTIVHYEPGLPGDFSLHTLNGSGMRWYIRLRTGLSEGVSFAVRLSGGPGRGEYSLGVSTDLKG